MIFFSDQINLQLATDLLDVAIWILPISFWLLLQTNINYVKRFNFDNLQIIVYFYFPIHFLCCVWIFLLGLVNKNFCRKSCIISTMEGKNISEELDISPIWMGEKCRFITPRKRRKKILYRSLPMCPHRFLHVCIRYGHIGKFPYSIFYGSFGTYIRTYKLTYKSSSVEVNVIL